MTLPEMLGMAGLTLNVGAIFGAGMLFRGKMDQFQQQSEAQHKETKETLNRVKEDLSKVTTGLAVLEGTVVGTRRDLDNHTRHEEVVFQEFRDRNHTFTNEFEKARAADAALRKDLERLDERVSMKEEIRSLRAVIEGSKKGSEK